MADETPRQALGFFVAAIRELFEEAGVLLARDATGHMVSLEAIDTADPVFQRHAIGSGAINLLDLARARGWRLALDALVYLRTG